MAMWKGVFVLGTMAFGGFLGSCVVLPLALPLLWVPGARGVVHLWADMCKKQWMVLTALLLTYVGGIQVHAYGDKVGDDDRAMILCNHRTRIDWMVLWLHLMHLPGNQIRKLKIVLRSDLQKLPFFGWAMCWFRFIFLSRSWETDKVELGRMTEYYEAHDEQNTVMIFPEGTDFHTKAIAKSKEYAEQHGLPVLEHVLYPRTTGVEFLLGKVRGSMDAVWDTTLIFKDHKEGERPSEVSLAKGRFPKEIHVIVKRVPMEDFPTEHAALEKYLRDSFIAKDALLKEYHANGGALKSVPKTYCFATTPVQVLACTGYWGLALYLLVNLSSTWFGIALILASSGAYIAFPGRMHKLMLATGGATRVAAAGGAKAKQQ